MKWFNLFLVPSPIGKQDKAVAEQFAEAHALGAGVLILLITLHLLGAAIMALSGGMALSGAWCRSAPPFVPVAHRGRDRIEAIRQGVVFGGRIGPRHIDGSLMTIESQAQDLLFSVNGAIAQITINRPEARNAFTFEMYEGLCRPARL